MNYIHLKTENKIITMVSDKVSRNIFIDLTVNAAKKLEVIEKALTKSDKLEDSVLDKMLTKKILTW